MGSYSRDYGGMGWGLVESLGLLLLVAAVLGGGVFWAFGPSLGWELPFRVPFEGVVMTAGPAPLTGVREPTAAGATADRPPAAATAAPTPAGPFCGPGEAPKFVLGFARLRERVGAAMGDATECEHPNAANGDSLQQTSTGLAVFQKSDGSLRFTDGWHHWLLRGDELVSWEGTEADPPAGR